MEPKFLRLQFDNVTNEPLKTSGLPHLECVISPYSEGMYDTKSLLQMFCYHCFEDGKEKDYAEFVKFFLYLLVVRDCLSQNVFPL